MTHCCSVPPQREPFGFDAVTHLLNLKKGEPTWSIDTRESTAEIFYEDSPNDIIDFWRATALSYQAELRLIERSRDYRLLIQSASYWETEAKHLENECIRIREMEDGHHQSSSGEDGPVSSRLRVREMNISSEKDKARKPATKPKAGAKLSNRVEKPRKRSRTDRRPSERKKASWKEKGS